METWRRAATHLDGQDLQRLDDGRRSAADYDGPLGVEHAGGQLEPLRMCVRAGGEAEAAEHGGTPVQACGVAATRASGRAASHSPQRTSAHSRVLMLGLE